MSREPDRPGRQSGLMLIVSLVILIVTLAIVFATQARADSWSWFDEDDNRQIMQEVADALADVELLFETGPLEARTGWVGAVTVFAVADGTGITINKAWSTRSYEWMAQHVNADIAAGYHNGGCTPIRTVALHEAGHVINNLRGGLPTMEAQAAVGYRPRPELRGELSGYSFNEDGSVNAGEAIAEAFQAVMCGSGGTVEQALYEMLVH